MNMNMMREQRLWRIVLEECKSVVSVVNISLEFLFIKQARLCRYYEYDKFERWIRMNALTIYFDACRPITGYAVEKAKTNFVHHSNYQSNNSCTRPLQYHINWLYMGDDERIPA